LEFPLLKDHPLKVIYNSLCGIRDTHAVYEKNDKTGATSVTGTAYHSGVERETKSLVFCDGFVDYCLSFFFWPWYCLSFTVSDSPFAIFPNFLGEADSNVEKLTDGGWMLNDSNSSHDLFASSSHCCSKPMHSIIGCYVITLRRTSHFRR
jgi:hypothetical protein